MTHPFYNAHHSPVGAFATRTLGCKGAKGGLGLVGVEDREGGRYQALPFFDGHEEDDGVKSHSDFHRPRTVGRFPDEEIERTMGEGVAA